MVLRQSELKRVLEKLKKRLHGDLKEGKLIFKNLENGVTEGVILDPMGYIPLLEAFILKVEDLIPNLQKEVTEAMSIGVEVIEAFEASSDTLKSLLALLNYVYGPDSPTIMEYFTPPTWWGFGQNVESRLYTHLRLNEAFGRHGDDFSGKMIADFELAATEGAALKDAWTRFQAEEAESKEVTEECISTLRHYRTLRRKIRNSLKGQLERTEDAYLYVPKQKRTKN